VRFLRRQLAALLVCRGNRSRAILGGARAAAWPAQLGAVGCAARSVAAVHCQPCDGEWRGAVRVVMNATATAATPNLGWTHPQKRPGESVPTDHFPSGSTGLADARPTPAEVVVSDGRRSFAPGCYRNCYGKCVAAHRSGTFEFKMSPRQGDGCGRGDSNFEVACCRRASILRSNPPRSFASGCMVSRPVGVRIGVKPLGWNDECAEAFQDHLTPIARRVAIVLAAIFRGNDTTRCEL
jgi:hypothetical protein